MRFALGVCSITYPCYLTFHITKYIIKPIELSNNLDIYIYYNLFEYSIISPIRLLYCNSYYYYYDYSNLAIAVIIVIVVYINIVPLYCGVT